MAGRQSGCWWGRWKNSVWRRKSEGRGGKEKKPAGGKGGDRLLVSPCLYPTSNSEALPWTQSPVWSEPSEHDANAAMLMQHPVPHTHTHTHTPWVNLFPCFLPRTLLWGSQQLMRGFAILFLNFSTDDVSRALPPTVYPQSTLPNEISNIL